MKVEKATLGGGCFWCLEAIFQRVLGIQSVVSGYAGGQTFKPGYEAVCSGTTGHAEVVQLEFDSKKISYADLLFIFFRVHDPTTLNRQQNDRGTQYRSIILTHSHEQKELAVKLLVETDREKIWDDPIVTEIKPLDAFYSAEDYHQNFFQSNRFHPYCVSIIDPKLKGFYKKLPDMAREEEERL